ncbi:sigma 54-interacting transcriptional regulator [Proteiniborus sp. MB09-C3]|uniref:sigma-54 interaction domain-containing protein n=1 Tax=Proteiniborus sp. MB09-C3 TaxID=3050072 RepID=UPI0025561712|nr:sigma 54-interacting transcriptional regulator [Proteiniborus sp. MB09-C3]WIV13058.1 sigma 54-interacting transcriptional regulator [Proteiniborus sp. MB09-C3]
MNTQNIESSVRSILDKNNQGQKDNDKDKYLNDIAKSMLNSMQDGIYITDKNGYTLFVNEAYERISGLKREQLIGKHMVDLIMLGYFDDSASLKVLRENKPMSIIDNFEGGRRCLVTSSPVYDKEGNILLIITNLRYMTELHDLQAKLEMTEELNSKYSCEINELRKENINRDNIIGNSKSMKLVYETIDRISEVDTTVLILGETGVGKEVIAKEIHKRSLRKSGPFIKVNCASIPDTLFESELFGYEKGAFTGAMNTGKPGLFELAEEGTILLDEIGEISLASQTKLLRVLQEKQTLRLGGTTPKEIDVRIIAATNKDLKDLVDKGKFREDLYYRLNVIPIRVPSLRERNEDIIFFAFHFLEEFNLKYKKNKSLNYKAYEILKSYYWPGNVRQLKNLIERIVLICPTEVIDETYINNILGNNNLINNYILEDNITLEEAVSDLEKQLIYKALRSHGSTRKAAEALGVSQPTVVRKAKRYNIKAK